MQVAFYADIKESYGLRKIWHFNFFHLIYSPK